MKRTTICLMTCLLAAVAATARAQQRPASATPGTETPLKLQVIMTRYDGDKKVSSMPYTVLLNTDPVTGEVLKVDVTLTVVK
jgi:hypothetical protein